MSFPDLRAFLDQLRRDDDLVTVESEVDPNLEVAEIHRRVVAGGGPALLFTNVKGSGFRLVTNLFGTARRAEMAFGERPLRLIRRLVELIETVVARDDCGELRVVAVVEELKQLLLGPGCAGLGAEIVQDQQLGAPNCLEELVVGDLALRAERKPQVVEQVGHDGEHRRFACRQPLVSDRRRQVASGELEREIRAIEDAARHEAADRDRARATVREERRSASAAAVAEAVSQYLAIVTGRGDRAEGER